MKKGTKSKTKSKKSTRKPHFLLPPNVQKDFMRKVGKLWYWTHHPFSKVFVGVAKIKPQSAHPRFDEWKKAVAEKRQPHIIANALRLAKAEGERLKTGKKSSTLGKQVAGWKTEMPQQKERAQMAKMFPPAFLVFEEIIDKKSGEKEHKPLFPIVGRSAMKSKKFFPDCRA